MKNTNTKEYATLLRRVKSNQRKLETDLMNLTEYSRDDNFITEKLWKMSDRMKTDREFIRNVMPKPR